MCFYLLCGHGMQFRAIVAGKYLLAIFAERYPSCRVKYLLAIVEERYPSGRVKYN